LVTLSHKNIPQLPLGDVFIWVFGIMGFERPLRKQSGGLFSGRGRVPWNLSAAIKGRRQVPFLYCTFCEWKCRKMLLTQI